MAELNPPLGTTTPEIFMDNVKRADELVNGPAGTVNDRGGEPLDTWRQMMAKNDEIRQNLIPLSRQYMTLTDAQADIANIPEGSTTFVRSPDDSALADEYINNGGTLEATGRKMPSQGYIDQNNTVLAEGIDSLNGTRLELTRNLADTYVDNRNDKTELIISADSAGRKILKIDLESKRLKVFGNDTPYQEEVDESRDAGSETWRYDGSDADRIILLADSAGRIIRYLKLSEQTEYLFGKRSGSQSYVAPNSWPEFIDHRSFGQSLSVSYSPGGASGPSIPTTFSNGKMFNGGIAIYNHNLTSFADIPTTPGQQYYDLSYLHQLQLNGLESYHINLAAASGVPGYSMAQLEPGTEPYNQLMSSIDKAAELAQNSGYQYGMPTLTFFQGEQDAYLGSSYAYYRSKMVLMQSSVNAKVKTVSRVNSDMPMIIYQMASQGRYQGLVNPSSDIPRAQLDEAISNPLIQLCTPMYIFPYVDGVHLTNDGYRWLGLFREKAVRYWMEHGVPWKPLYPANIFKVGNKTVMAQFNVPVGALQFRTDIVPEHPAGAKGFELWQDDGTGNLTAMEISSVQILGTDKVKVTSSLEFTGKIYLAYGWTPLNRGESDGAGRYPSWNAGVNSGVCGNLCDSDDSETDLLDTSGTPYQLKNYCCVFFKEAI
ncbi:sialate O-acetylesterase [Klebsiella pneumoniae]|uniref:sialate O-acetylesterase n=2 Tax=Klebsiella pneumoniae TaxID=573 RepID=UPI0021ADD4C7|nr:sialate O-acetylesterase [Klebsiella pneumoniae]